MELACFRAFGGFDLEEKTNTQVELKAPASALIGTAVRGDLELGDKGLAFHYGKQNASAGLFFAWSEIEKVELNISIQGKLKKDFAVFARGNTFRFTSDEVGQILKLIRQKIGSDKMIRARNLFSPFVIFGK